MLLFLNMASSHLSIRFTCRVCGKDKAPASYSKTQLQKWFNKKRNDRYNAVTPHNVGLTCKDHASDQREIRCHGPCDRLKVVDHFSKNQRNEPEPVSKYLLLFTTQHIGD